MMSKTTGVDVRPIEPKFRYDVIMEAYNKLDIGQSMDLTVDHDPQCMYYTLRATRGDDAFAFKYIERGPETWRVIVTRLLSDATEVVESCH
jgi:uncharacterized protein (DUF2249 family)